MATVTDRLRYFESLRIPHERVLWAALSILGRPDGFLDIGAGDGYVVRTAAASAVKPALGVESDADICANSAIGSRMLCRVLTKPFKIIGPFELVFCLRAPFDLSTDLEALGENLVMHTHKWLVCVEPYPQIVMDRLYYRDDLTQRMRCAVDLNLGVFSRE